MKYQQSALRGLFLFGGMMRSGIELTAGNGKDTACAGQMKQRRIAPAIQQAMPDGQSEEKAKKGVSYGKIVIYFRVSYGGTSG